MSKQNLKDVANNKNNGDIRKYLQLPPKGLILNKDPNRIMNKVGINFILNWSIQLIR